jgi:hypothetical protein
VEASVRCGDLHQSSHELRARLRKQTVQNIPGEHEIVGVLGLCGEGAFLSIQCARRGTVVDEIGKPNTSCEAAVELESRIGRSAKVENRMAAVLANPIEKRRDPGRWALVRG